jgi:hypothetical protein
VVVLDFFFFFLVDFVFFGSDAGFPASADFVGAAFVGTAGAAAGVAALAGVADIGGEAGAVGGVCAMAVSANALATKAIKILLIVASFSRVGLDTNPAFRRR